MRQARAVRYVCPMLSGAGQQTASRPHLLVGDDGSEYVVKLLRDCTANRTLANEQVAGAVAEALAVSFPGIVHLDVSAELINNSPELVALNTIPGLYLGCRRLLLAFDLNKTVPADLADRIVNPEDALGAIALDIYVWNMDRNNAGNLLVEPTGEAHRYRLYIIDHGHCFTGPAWTDASLAAQAPQPYNVPTHPLLRQCATRAGDGESWVQQIEQLGDAALELMVDEIPLEWNLTDSSRVALKAYLRERKVYSRRDCRARGVPCR